MRVELLCEIFIHTQELPILVSLHYDMDLYIGIDVKIVKYYYRKRHEGNQSLYYLMQHMYATGCSHDDDEIIRSTLLWVYNFQDLL